MEIKDFVKIYDDVIPLTCVSNIIRFVKKSNEFEKAKVGGSSTGESKVNFDIRKTWNFRLSNLNNKLSNVHWFNFLMKSFNDSIQKYINDLKILHLSYSQIVEINVLKYEDKGFYNWHTDHFAAAPRTLSCILLLNNDYEGGNLCFRNPDGSSEWEVEVKANRMIIWPSCFMYPHTVKRVTKGTRYSVVAWAL